MSADRSVLIRLQVASAEFDAAMAKAGLEVRALKKEVEGAGSSSTSASQKLNQFLPHILVAYLKVVRDLLVVLFGVWELLLTVQITWR